MHAAQSISSPSVVTSPAHEPPAPVTRGHVRGKPISVGPKSPAPLHRLSAPPQALQIRARMSASAAAIRAMVLPEVSPSGHGAWTPGRPMLTSLQQRSSADTLVAKNFAVCSPIACWHRASALLVVALGSTSCS
jgi:hypothetical protein